MDLARALGALAERPGPEHARLAGAVGLPVPGPVDHTDLFRFQLPPYASVYLGAEGMLGGEARDRVAGFWRALGAVPPPEPDHLATLLGAWASLVERDAAEGDREDGHAAEGHRKDGGAAADARPSPWGHARRVFFWEHLASWIPPYLARVEEAGASPYRLWATLLRGLLEDEARRLGAPPVLPAALTAAPPLDVPGPDAGLDDLLAPLLAPARSGVVLTRRDLASAAHALGLGLRQGERRFILRSLLTQAPAPVLAWLAGEAGRQATTRAAGSPLEPVLGHWRGRAQRTARVLAEAGSVAAGVTPREPLEEAAHA